MADHGWKYEARGLWQRLFFTSVHSVEWHVKAALRDFTGETITTEMSTDPTGNWLKVFISGYRFADCKFDKVMSLCQEVWVEGEQIARSPRKGRD